MEQSSQSTITKFFKSPTKAIKSNVLIEFVEETIFSRITIILNEEKTTAKRCEQIIFLLLKIEVQIFLKFIKT